MISDRWDGVYGIVWAGMVGVGGCVARIEAGQVAARDGAGIIYTGHLDFDEATGALHLHLQDQGHEGSRLVSGMSPLDLPLGRSLKALLPIDFADISHFSVPLPSGDIDIMCRRTDPAWASKI